jgi:hypothetical protein
MSRWVVVISGKQYVNELCKAPGDVLSFDEPSIEVSGLRRTMKKIYGGLVG